MAQLERELKKPCEPFELDLWTLNAFDLQITNEIGKWIHFFFFRMPNIRPDASLKDYEDSEYFQDLLYEAYASVKNQEYLIFESVQIFLEIVIVVLCIFLLIFIIKIKKNMRNFFRALLN